MIAFSKRISGNFVKSGKAKLSGRDFSYDEYDSFGVGASLIDQTVKDGVSYDFMYKAYQVNPWIRGIVDKIIARVTQVEIFPQPVDLGQNVPKKASKQQKKRMEEIAELLVSPNDNYESFRSIVRKQLLDSLIYDNAGIEIVNNGNKKFELYCNAPGLEIYPNVKKNGEFASDEAAYYQIRNQKKLTTWAKSEMMFFVKNQISGRVRGFSPIESIALQISADLFSDKYNIDFFSNNARPNIAFLFENLGFGKGQAALRRAKQWYLEEHQGNPHLPLFMGAEKGTVKLQELQMSNSDMEFQEYQVFLLSKIMAVYGMQPLILGVINSTTGKLNSQEQVNQFKIDAVQPYLNLMLENMNIILIRSDANFGYKDVYLEHADLDLRDTLDAAAMYEKYLRNGVITINQVRQELQMAPVPWGDVPYIPVNIAPLGGSAPDRMGQNPAAAKPPKPKKEDGIDLEDVKGAKSYALLDNVKESAGMYFVPDHEILSTINKLIMKRQSKLNKVYSYDSEDIDENDIGKLGHKIKW